MLSHSKYLTYNNYFFCDAYSNSYFHGTKVLIFPNICKKNIIFLHKIIHIAQLFAIFALL